MFSGPESIVASGERLVIGCPKKWVRYVERMVPVVLCCVVCVPLPPPPPQRERERSRLVVHPRVIGILSRNFDLLIN
uniref:Uncharacterized protein n=1 Tax=Arundo donax TaxID=35708 RepID=A0A0A9AXR6_ARUDO